MSSEGHRGPRGGPAERLYLLRHGQTEPSARRRYSGRQDVALTAEGRQQAELAARSLGGAGIDVVHASPLQRAADTAAALASAAGARLVIDRRLVEVDYGVLEGMDREEAAARFGEPFSAWRRDPMGSPMPGVEPLSEALARAAEATADVVAGSRRPAIVAHQGILRMVLVALGGMEADDYFEVGFGEAQPVEIAEPTVRSGPPR